MIYQSKHAMQLTLQEPREEQTPIRFSLIACHLIMIPMVMTMMIASA